MGKLNSIDEQLIDLLENDARQSSEVLAKQLDISPSSVRRRIRKLIKDGVINILAIVNPTKISLPLPAIISLDVASDKLDSVMRNLSKQPFILWQAITTGQFDIVIWGRFPSNEELLNFVQYKLAKIEGVTGIETSICLRLERTRYLYDFKEKS